MHECEGHGQHNIARRRVILRVRDARSLVHAAFEQAEPVAELHVNGFQRGGDLLAICADVLHHARANRARNAGKPLKTFKSPFHAELYEVVPVHAGLRVHMHGVVAAFNGGRFIWHDDVAACVTDHHTVEFVVRGEHVRTAADHAERNAFGVGVLHLLDQRHACGRFDETFDIATNIHGGEFSKTCHTAHSNKKPDHLAGF